MCIHLPQANVILVEEKQIQCRETPNPTTGIKKFQNQKFSGEENEISVNKRN